MTLVRPLRLFYVVFKPAIWCLNRSSNFILKKALQDRPRRRSGTRPQRGGTARHPQRQREIQEVTTVGKELLINTLDLRRRVVRDIMTPRGAVVYLDIDQILRRQPRPHALFAAHPLSVVQGAPG